jgi:hypothetical protein
MLVLDENDLTSVSVNTVKTAWPNI